MKSAEEIKGFYTESLKPALTALDARRKAIVTRLLIGLGATVLVAGVTALLTLPDNPIPAPILLVVGLITSGVIAWLPSRGYRREFKRRIIAPIVGFIDPGLTYSPEGRISEGVYMDSELFKQRPDRYQGDDLVRGTIGETRVEFSELHTEYKTTRTDDKGNKKTSWHTIFRGLFFVADFNKEFKGTTVVLPDTAERLFGRMGKMLQSWNFTRDQLIKLEDPEFEREFAVYGSDQIEARYILSPALMERIVAFKRKSKRRIHLSFVRSNLHVAISYKRDLFEPRIFRSILSFDAVSDYFDDLQLAVGIVEELNLNTRIWSKA